MNAATTILAACLLLTACAAEPEPQEFRRVTCMRDSAYTHQSGRFADIQHRDGIWTMEGDGLTDWTVVYRQREGETCWAEVVP